MSKKAALHNLGCKVNAYETEVMEQLLKEAGYEIVPFEPGADVYVINTCTVTNIADRKSRQMLHRARKMNPEAIVVAAGCYVQASGEEAASDDAIDIVIGNNRKNELVEAIRLFEETRRSTEEQCWNPQIDHSRTTAYGTDGVPNGNQAADEVNDPGAAAVHEDTTRNITDGNEITTSGTAAVQGDTTRNIADGNEITTSGAAAVQEDTARNIADGNEVITPDTAARHGQTYVDITDLSHGSEYESTFLASTQEHTRAYLKVQDGCNQFCSYCIIPYARGRVRSRKLEEVVAEVKSLAGNGCREIVLTGIHLSSYGVDTGSSLLELIRTVHEIDGIERIRLGSLEPGIVTEKFAASLAALPKVCPHFHLSLQSGCDETLRRMNRKYTAEEYREKCRILRAAFTRPALTTDVIVGFPAETEEEFETTVRFLVEIAFYETHIFKYSRRKGTRAAAMPQQIPEQEKAVRSERLIALGDENRRRFEQSWQGCRAEVLMEEIVTLDGKTWFTGYTKEYIKTVIPADADYTNCVVTGQIGEEVAPHIYRLLDTDR